jgi:hypothetical protein
MQSLGVFALRRAAALSHFEACVPAWSAAARLRLEVGRRQACGGDQPCGHGARAEISPQIAVFYGPHGRG